MTQLQLNLDLAEASGESWDENLRPDLCSIAMLEQGCESDEIDVPPQIVDWDALELERCALFPTFQATRHVNRFH